MKPSEFLTPQTPLKSAVLFLVFNRPETTREVFLAIRKAKPPRLYIAADGPRLNNTADRKNIREVRDFVIHHIDWECDVKFLFRDKNLGCKYGVSEAITWFFENEEMGIILEDDCLPSQSFFWFCEELLERFKNDTRIYLISGRNDLGIYQMHHNLSYFFSTGRIWGWATWKRAWMCNDPELRQFNNPENIRRLRRYYQDSPKKFNEVLQGCRRVRDHNLDTWDYQWSFSRAIHGGISVHPVKNLIVNIGFQPDATHTTEKPGFEPNRYEIEFPLRHNSDFTIEVPYLKKIEEMANHKPDPGKKYSIGKIVKSMREKYQVFLSRR